MLSAGQGAWQQPARTLIFRRRLVLGRNMVSQSCRGEQTGLKDSALIPMTSTDDPSNPHSVSYSPENGFP